MEEIQITLARLELMTYKERREQIKALEDDGYTIEYRFGYRAIKNGITYTIPIKQCEGICKQYKTLTNFVGRSRVMPWCVECRSLDPIGAKRANDLNRQRNLPDDKRASKNANHAIREKERRVEMKQAPAEARTLVLEALDQLAATQPEYVKREILKIRAEIEGKA